MCVCAIDSVWYHLCPLVLRSSCQCWGEPWHLHLNWRQSCFPSSSWVLFVSRDVVNMWSYCLFVWFFVYSSSTTSSVTRTKPSKQSTTTKFCTLFTPSLPPSLPFSLPLFLLTLLPFFLSFLTWFLSLPSRPWLEIPSLSPVVSGSYQPTALLSTATTSSILMTWS